MTSRRSPEDQRIRLDDGREVVLRPLRSDDLAALQRAFARLTADEIRFRFMELARQLPDSIVAQVRDLDAARVAAFVVDDDGEIRAVADLHIGPADSRDAEFGLIVGKAVAGQGLGKRLMLRLLDEARRRGLATVTGCVGAENARMLRLCQDLGGSIAPVAGDAALKSVSFKP